MADLYKTLTPNIRDNTNLRPPQREAFDAMTQCASDEEAEREIGLILPVDCGKSGCITIAPFAFGASRVLVVAPNLKIATQLSSDFDPANDEMFYKNVAC